jgi:hypothetical protein
MIDRCLQTSKPVSDALGVPIFVEHGTYFLALIHPFHSPDRPIRVVFTSDSQYWTPSQARVGW